MSEIKRYELICNCDSHQNCPGKMLENPEGEYCLYSEVETLLKQRDQQLQQKDERIKYFEGVCDGMNKELVDNDEKLVNYKNRCVEYADTLTSYRELMGRMRNTLFEIHSKYQLSDSGNERIDKLLTDYKNLEG